MKPSVEKGLASHSSIMVAPREFAHGCEDGDGWIKVSSKKSLRKEKKIHKNKPSKDISFFSAENNQDEVSSATDSNKSSTSGSSWASILKRSLKMNVPRVSIDIASTSTASKNSEDLKNEVKYLKTVHTYEDKNEVDPPKVQQPPQVITIQESDEASFTNSEFGENESTSSKKAHQTSTVQQEFPENDEGSTFSGQIKNNQIRVSYLDNKRRHETAFSATCPTEINDIDKDKKIKKVSKKCQRSSPLRSVFALRSC